MVKEIIKTLTKKGKKNLLFSIIAFTIYALSSIAMIAIAVNAIYSITNKTQTALYLYWIGLVVCLLLKGVSNILADVQKHYAGLDIVYQIKEKIILRLKSLSLGFFTNERIGEISSIIHKDVDNMELVVGHMWPRMLADVVVSIIVIIYLLTQSWILGVLIICTIPVAIFYLVKGLSEAQDLEEKTSYSIADMVSLFVEYVKGIQLLKAFSNSKKFDEKLKDSAGVFAKYSKASSKNRAKVLSVYGLLIDLSFILMVIVGAIMLLNETVMIYTFILFVVIGREVYKPFIALEKHWIDYVKVTDSFKRIQKITTAPIVPISKNPKTPKSYNISFENVSFGYESHEFEMKDLSFLIKENTLTALVGESGSGKTTITNLLLRFWDCEKGEIKIGGIDIRDIYYDTLLEKISIVMQNVKLFSGTFEDNIKLGKKNATREEVIEAAKKARIHEFITDFPDGYDTVLGESAKTLSGGQRQRLSIARAFLKDAPILLLDELTSNVDPINDALIQDVITELSKNRTVIVIAHNLSTIKTADQIIVLRNGHIAEKGVHSELIENDGYYSLLWNQKQGVML